MESMKGFCSFIRGQSENICICDDSRERSEIIEQKQGMAGIRGESLQGDYMNQKQKVKSYKNLWVTLWYALIGTACIVVTLKYIHAIYSDDLLAGKKLFYLGLAFLGMYLAKFLQTVLHEAGHLVAGLCSGYKFLSFRVGSLMWEKRGREINFRRNTLAGGGGQCLMAPPDLVDGKMPYVFFNLGGVLMNLFTVLACGVLFAFFSKMFFLSLFLLMMGITGLGNALMNGIPMRSGRVHNDGSNVKAISETPESLRAFWVQLKVAELASNGVCLKDMPGEWFYVPDEKGIKNSMTAGLAVYCETLMMEAKEFEEAAALVDRLLHTGADLTEVCRSMLICDRLYCELLGDEDSEIIESLYTKSQKWFMSLMQNSPAVLRTEYAYAMLYEKNADKAAQIRERFEKCAKIYPYAADIESERELLEVVEGMNQPAE